MVGSVANEVDWEKVLGEEFQEGSLIFPDGWMAGRVQR